MSRIQNILDKAERDGTVRRMRTAPEPMAAAGLATFEDPAPMLAPPPSPPPADNLGAAAASAVPELTPARVVRGVRLAPTLVTALAPDAVAAEQYRALRTRVVHADNGAPVHVLLVTSPGRGEGKSVTAANLALAMAQEYQQRICVVDANLRHPHLHRLFDLAEAPGLTDVLIGRASLDDALVTLDEHHITVLPAGDPAAHPAELLGTVTMRRLLE